MNNQSFLISHTPEKFLHKPFIIFPEANLKSLPNISAHDYLHFGGYVELSYAEIRELIVLLKSRLTGKIVAGERIGIYCTNLLQTILGILTAWEIGAVPVMVNIKLHQKEILEQFRLTECSAMLCDDTPVGLQEIEHIFKISDLFSMNQGGDDNGFSEFNSEIGVYIFTSGVTGTSKAVEQSFIALAEAFRLGYTPCNYNADDLWLLSLPLFHISGFSVLVRTLLSHAAIVVTESGNSEILAEVFKKVPVTLCSLVPTQLKRLVDSHVIPPESLRYSFIGGGRSEIDLIEKSIEAGWKSVVVYGSSETSAFVTALLPHQFKSKNNCVGLPLAGVIIRILDEQGAILGAGIVGEVCISSPTLFRKYFNNKHETEAKLVEGYYRTGDYGYIDEDGYLFVTGRKGDIINSGGEKIDPFEIETLLLQLPYVTMCSVIGMPHAEWGEAVTGVVVLLRNAQISELEIINALAEHLPSYKLPKKICFLDNLPMTDLGKINRNKLKELLLTRFSI